jgi:SPP1 gp7 family putative phage head morphogenesis protein
MCEVAHITVNELVVNIFRYDPTRTATLRKFFSREGNKRFNEFIKNLYKAIRTDSISPFYKYLSSTDKLEELEVWLERNSGRIVSNWFNKYLYDAYAKGIARARSEMIKAGYSIPSVIKSGGVETIMLSPFHKELYGLLNAKVMGEIKNIYSQMTQQLIRVLSQSLANGDDIKTIAKKVFATITGKGVNELGIDKILGKFVPAKRRLEIMARTETVRAHHQAMIEEYRSWGVDGVYVIAEWKTAGDSKVCAKCAEKEGRRYTLDEIMLEIPAHPLCRCIAIPIKVKGGK